MTTGPEQLLERESSWVTDLGAWFPDQGRVIFRGKEVFRDLKDFSWMAMWLYAITGRQFTAKQLRLFEGCWVLCTSYPDPRLWNNRVAALAGSSRSTAGLALGAATAVSDASIYGGRPCLGTSDFLHRTQQQLDQGADLAELLREEYRKHRTIPGYGRPLARRDERIEPMMRLAESLGLASGPYVALAFRIQKQLRELRLRFRMNAAALCAALTADQGLSPREFYHFASLSFSAGIIACYVDAAARPEGTLFPLRCARLAYQGPPPRSWEPPSEPP
ncbi:citryl-CoA lyase [Candidatus Methylocalor cossyra]|uniref:Citrate synthase (unknown stereospecificity) n=1 Tax=Candidatus Methylocalor cossyra TaxID=3108543 RepID=A0ABM9NLD2_9GAMM